MQPRAQAARMRAQTRTAANLARMQAKAAAAAVRCSAPRAFKLRVGPGANATIDVQESGTFLDNASKGNLEMYLLGWGADYMFTKQFALNTEMAYKRNDGHATINGVRINDWNASSFGFLVGVKLFF